MVTPFAEGAVVRASQSAKFVDIDLLTGGGAVLVLTPHPDDESLGCGGAIAAAVRAGSRILIVVLTDGRLSHPRSNTYPAPNLVSLRQQELTDAVGHLTGRTGEIHFLDFPDQGVPTNGAARKDIRNRLLALIDANNIRALWTTWEKDPHCDHRSAAEICRDVKQARPNLKYWRFPVWGRFVEDSPQAGETLYRFDTKPFLAEKTAAVKSHCSQMTPLIPDDPDGFVMDTAAQRHFIESPELFIGGATDV